MSRARRGTCAASAGKNYGWPTYTFSRQYDGSRGSPQMLAADIQPPLLLWSPSIATALVFGFAAWNLAQFGEWAVNRTYKNYQSSLAIGQALPPETLVQGKLANGLALENRIRPIFIGHEFGNYADRKERDDVRYILTYTSPELGYEGSQITDVLDASPGWRIIMSFDVAETPSGKDQAVLIEKRARH